MYSDISTRIRFCSEPKITSAIALDSSVFPTPVGPRNIKEPMGRFGSFKPTRPLLIACATAFTASFWPITLSWRRFSRFFSLSVSVSSSFLVGIFVQSETTWAMSDSRTWRRFSSLSFFQSSSSLLRRFLFCSCFLLIWEAPSKSSLRMQSSFSSSNSAIWALNFLIAAGSPLFKMRILEAASSIKSMALSGKYRSLI